MNHIITKSTLRKQVLKIRDQLTPEERNRSAILLTERICGHQWFYRSDILALAMMGASFGNQDRISILQMIQKSGALYISSQIAFIAGKQQGERRHRDISRDEFRNLPEDLAVCDDKFWLFP